MNKKKYNSSKNWIKLYKSEIVFLNDKFPQDISNLIFQYQIKLPPLFLGFLELGYNPFNILKDWKCCGHSGDGSEHDNTIKYFDRFFYPYKRDKPPMETRCSCNVKIKTNFYIANPNNPKDGNIFVIGSSCIKNFWGTKLKKCKDCENYMSFEDIKKIEKKEKKRCRKCTKLYNNHKLKIKTEKKEQILYLQMIEKKKIEEKKIEDERIFMLSHCQGCKIFISEHKRKYGGRCYKCNMSKKEKYKFKCETCEKPLEKSFYKCFGCSPSLV